jgi:hypothetical protein
MTSEHPDSLLRHRPFVLFWFARVATTMAYQMLVVAIGWQLYERTHDAWSLGFVGLGPGDGVSLGAILEQGTAGMVRAPHVLAFGALAVMAERVRVIKRRGRYGHFGTQPGCAIRLA